MSYTIASLFRRPSLTFLLGAFGSKKTWLALDLAVCTATRQSWLGLPVGAHCSAPNPTLREPLEGVLYLDNELGLSAFRYRLRSVLQARHAPSDTPLRFACFPDIDFARQQSVEGLTHTTLSHNAGLLIIDQLLPLPLGRGRAGVGAFIPLLTNLRHLADHTNAAVLVLQHTRHRRTSLPQALIAMGADQVLGVYSPYGQPLIHLRSLDPGNQPPVSLTADLHLGKPLQAGPWGDPIFTSLSPSTKKPTPPIGKAGLAVLNVLNLRNTATAIQIMASIPVSTPGWLAHVINNLIKEGYLQRTNPGAKV